MIVQRRNIDGRARFPWVRVWREGRWVVVDVWRWRWEFVR